MQTCNFARDMSGSTEFFLFDEETDFIISLYFFQEKFQRTNALKNV
jgi:hypothetical protein